MTTKQMMEEELEKHYPIVTPEKIEDQELAEMVGDVYRNMLRQSMIRVVEAALGEAMILCRHDSIPSYTAGAEDGCIRCKHNEHIQSIITSIKE